MDNELRFFKIDKPKLIRRNSAWWLTAGGAAAAIIILFYPPSTEYSYVEKFVIALLSFIIVPFVIVISIYSIKLILMFLKRIIFYEKLYSITENKIDQLDRAQETILALKDHFAKTLVVEIHKVQYYRNSLYLVIKKKRGLTLKEGSTLAVIDTDDGMIMGFFKVNELRENEYLAKNNGFVDPLWKGYVNQTGESELFAPPHTVAILIQEELN